MQTFGCKGHLPHIRDEEENEIKTIIFSNIDAKNVKGVGNTVLLL